MAAGFQILLGDIDSCKCFESEVSDGDEKALTHKVRVLQKGFRFVEGSLQCRA